MALEDVSVPPPSVFDRLPLPPAGKLLGWTLLAVDPEAGTIEIRFTADDRFLNPAGTVQGGFLAAMLDDRLGVGHHFDVVGFQHEVPFQPDGVESIEMPA